MKKITLAIFIFSSYLAISQKISTFDIVKINAKYEKEAMYFYEQNWLAFRKEALKQKVISGYEMYRSPADTTHHFDLTLITIYKNEKAFKVSEEKFRLIMKAISPDGPKYLNEVRRDQFLKYIAGSEGKLIHPKK